MFEVTIYNISLFFFLPLAPPPIYPSKNFKFMASFFTKCYCMCVYTYMHARAHAHTHTHSVWLMLPTSMSSGLAAGVLFLGRTSFPTSSGPEMEQLYSIYTLYFCVQHTQ